MSAQHFISTQESPKKMEDPICESTTKKTLGKDPPPITFLWTETELDTLKEIQEETPLLSILQEDDAMLQQSFEADPSTDCFNMSFSTSVSCPPEILSSSSSSSPGRPRSVKFDSIQINEFPLVFASWGDHPHGRPSFELAWDRQKCTVVDIDLYESFRAAKQHKKTTIERKEGEDQTSSCYIMKASPDIIRRDKHDLVGPVQYDSQNGSLSPPSSTKRRCGTTKRRKKGRCKSLSPKGSSKPLYSDDRRLLRDAVDDIEKRTKKLSEKLIALGLPGL